jgi:hypothetical protein
MPQVIPATLPETLIIAHPARRDRSALIGTAAHSPQSVLLRALVLCSVLKR